MRRPAWCCAPGAVATPEATSRHWQSVAITAQLSDMRSPKCTKTCRRGWVRICTACVRYIRKVVQHAGCLRSGAHSVCIGHPLSPSRLHVCLCRAGQRGAEGLRRRTIICTAKRHGQQLLAAATSMPRSLCAGRKLAPALGFRDAVAHVTLTRKRRWLATAASRPPLINVGFDCTSWRVDASRCQKLRPGLHYQANGCPGLVR